MVLLNLSGKFFQHFTGKLNSIVVMFLELYELNEISDGFISLKICHLHIVVIKLVHNIPIVPISNSDDDNTERQSSAFHQQIFNLFLIVNDAVC